MFEIRVLYPICGRFILVLLHYTKEGGGSKILCYIYLVNAHLVNQSIFGNNICENIGEFPNSSATSELLTLNPNCNALY